MSHEALNREFNREQAEIQEAEKLKERLNHVANLRALRELMLAQKLTSREVADMFQTAMLAHINGSNWSGAYSGSRLAIYKLMVEVLRR